MPAKPRQDMQACLVNLLARVRVLFSCFSTGRSKESTNRHCFVDHKVYCLTVHMFLCFLFSGKTTLPPVSGWLELHWHRLYKPYWCSVCSVVCSRQTLFGAIRYLHTSTLGIQANFVGFRWSTNQPVTCDCLFKSSLAVLANNFHRHFP